MKISTIEYKIKQIYLFFWKSLMWSFVSNIWWYHLRFHFIKCVQFLVKCYRERDFLLYTFACPTHSIQPVKKNLSRYRQSWSKSVSFHTKQLFSNSIMFVLCIIFDNMVIRWGWFGWKDAHVWMTFILNLFKRVQFRNTKWVKSSLKL